MTYLYQSMALRPIARIKKRVQYALFFGHAPKGNRTPVLALRGPRPGPLDDGGWQRENSTMLPAPPSTKSMAALIFNFFMWIIPQEETNPIEFIVVWHPGSIISL
jgi:hypothetical protein